MRIQRRSLLLSLPPSLLPSLLLHVPSSLYPSLCISISSISRDIYTEREIQKYIPIDTGRSAMYKAERASEGLSEGKETHLTSQAFSGI